MDWRFAWNYLSGTAPPFQYPPHWAGSLIYYALIYASGAFLRQLNNSFIKPGHAQAAVADFIATFVACAFSMENMHIRLHYGDIGLCLVLFLQILYYIDGLEGATSSPTGNVEKWWERRIPRSQALVRIVGQILAAYVSYRVALRIWALDFLPEHKHKINQSSCPSDLNVSVLSGFLLEGGATLIDSYLATQVLLRSRLQDSSLKSAIDTAMVILGLHLTGMYFNPAMASANTFGCEGLTVFDHVFVYWIGPFLGCVLAVILRKKIKIT